MVSRGRGTCCGAAPPWCPFEIFPGHPFRSTVFPPGRRTGRADYPGKSASHHRSRISSSATFRSLRAALSLRDAEANRDGEGQGALACAGKGEKKFRRLAAIHSIRNEEKSHGDHETGSTELSLRTTAGKDRNYAHKALPDAARPEPGLYAGSGGALPGN